MPDFWGTVNSASGGGTPASTVDQVGTVAFARQVLAALGAPQSQGNISFLLTWFKREGTKAQYNPLATTLNYGSNTQFNKVGVKNYADQATGVQATAKTLLSPRYAGIVSDLKADNPQGAASNHPQEFKTWSGGGYDRLILGGVGDTIGGISTSAPTSTSGAGGVPTDALPAGATEEQTYAWIKEHSPQYAGYLAVPEVRDVLVHAAQDYSKGAPWSAQKVQNEIQATNWWRTTGDSARTYQQLQITDPATAEQTLQQKMAELGPEVDQLGLKLDLRVYADLALKYGWTPAQLAADEATRLRMASAGTGLPEGSTVDVTADSLMQMARNDYFVPLNRQDVEKWAIDIFEGRRTEDQYKSFLQNLAMGRFPGLKEMGVTPGEYLAPIRNVIADTLELQPADVDLLDPKWSAVLQQQGSDGKGSRPMTISEAQQWARSQPGYQYTKGARDTAAQFVETLGQRFGKVA